VLSPDPKLFDCSAYMAWEVSLVVWGVLVPLCHPETDSKCINLCSFNLQETTQCLHKVPSIFSTFILLHEERRTYGDQLYKFRTRCLLINSVLTMQKHFNLNYLHFTIPWQRSKISYMTNLWKLYINKSLCFSEMASMWNLYFILFKAEKW
jgi:hypothetical protein